ncbi:type I-E CRISPR-associated protein Cse2/CasB [Bifidobacterium rousetti]|uniref:type I-E CRISPR-associated protein Cse2/CasB n=1 Tax=Bifidobacterium rousetti TaxID=2045439 RepID=UPI0012393412|nr:type I-E CRISPR-associated protein Cse2/CasB [Bifidobacterium rousetti]KAA8819413.1 type I-E CRISPR-associated protein Cse2/CasB [Bifidobacterium rousetti]
MERQDIEQRSRERSRETRLTPFGSWVSRQVVTLMTGRQPSSGGGRKGYMGDDPLATAAIAKLRHGVGREIGDDPSLLAWTLPETDDPDIVGSRSSATGEPTARERAAYAAITLFAAHQQSIHDMPMYTESNVSLGYAIGRMAYGNFNEKGIRSRFAQLQTSNGWKELIRHARDLISLLKREHIAINYGMFAQDLLGLRSGRESANRVRLRWGRDFQRGYVGAQKTNDTINDGNNYNN